MCYEEAKHWAKRTLDHFELKGVAVLSGSPRCWHEVFDRRLFWREVCKEIARVCQETQHQGLTRWFLNQLARGELSLRVSPKDETGCPRVRWWSGSQDEEIAWSFEARRLVRVRLTES